MPRYPFTKQHDEKDCGAACLSMISEFYGLKLPLAHFRDLIKVDSQGANIYGLVTGAGSIGLEADALEGTPEELLDGIQKGEIRLPFIARIVTEQMFEHFIVVYGLKKEMLLVGDSGKSGIVKMPLSLFVKQWQGQIVTFAPNQHFEKKNEKEGSLKKFYKLIILQRKNLIFVFALSVIISIINVFGAVIFKYILTDSLEVSVFAGISRICIAIVLMYILRGVFQVIRGYLLAVTTKNIDVSLTRNYYEHLVELPLRFHETRKTGEFMSRFYDISKIRDILSTAVLTVVLDTIMAIACGILLYSINKILFLITLVVIIVYACSVVIFRKPINEVNHVLMENEAQVMSYLKESIDGIETIKANQCEKTVKGKSEELYKQFAQKNVKGLLIYNIQEAIVSEETSIGIVCLLWMGAYLCMKQMINVSDLFVFYYLIGYFLNPVSNLINLQPEIQTAMVAAERLNDVLDAKEEQGQTDKRELERIGEEIRLENISFRYGNRDMVLDRINMTFTKGKRVAIVGESGCGKTTIAKLLMAFHSPENGAVILDGVKQPVFSISSVRKQIAYISQDIFLFSDTVYNNLALGNRDITLEDVKRVCQLCRADDFIERLPMKYETMLEEGGSNLSGGQKQRLAIARALLRKPDVLIMDEATSNLDAVTEADIQKTIEKLSGEIICIIIAHRMNTIKNCDYTYVMDKGRVIEEGTHQSLLSGHGLYEKYMYGND